MKRFLILTGAMFLIHIRNRMTLFWNMFFPVFLMVIYTVIFGNFDVEGANFMAWVLPGVIVLNILAFGLMSSSSMIVGMRENGILRRLQATPVPVQTLVGAYLIVNVLIGLIQAGVILLTAVLFFGYDPTWQGILMAVPMIITAVVASVTLGQIISGVAAKAGVALALGQILYFSQMFITDMIMPIEQMPGWVQSVARYLPGYAITQLVRPPLMSAEWGAAVLPNLGLLVLYTLGGALLAGLLFRWSPRS